MPHPSSPDLLASPLAEVMSAGPVVTPDPALPKEPIAPSTSLGGTPSRASEMENQLTDLVKEKNLLDGRLATANQNREKYGRKQSETKSAREKSQWATKRLETELLIDRYQVRAREIDKNIRSLKAQIAAHKVGGRSVKLDAEAQQARKSVNHPKTESFGILAVLMAAAALCVHKIGGAFKGMLGTLDKDAQDRLLRKSTRSREEKDNLRLVQTIGGPNPTPMALQAIHGSSNDPSASNPFRTKPRPGDQLDDPHRSRGNGLAPRY